MSVIAGLLGLGGWLSRSLKLCIVPGCGSGKQALSFLLPSPWSSVLGVLANAAVGPPAIFGVSIQPAGRREELEVESVIIGQ